MIDEAATFEMFGYTSDEWAPQSHKKVVAVCERCGKHKVVEKKAARPLCTSCPKVGRVFSPETLRKKSENMKGEKNPMYGKTGILSPHYGKQLTEDHKRKLSDANIGKSRSVESIEKQRRNSNPRRGVDNNMWKGGVTPIMKRLRQSLAYKNWRTAVFERDDFTCQMCNKRGGYLEAHHIRPVRDHKNDLLLLDIDNGITLCKKCHSGITKHEEDFSLAFTSLVGGKR